MPVPNCSSVPTRLFERFLYRASTNACIELLIMTPCALRVLRAFALVIAATNCAFAPSRWALSAINLLSWVSSTPHCARRPVLDHLRALALALAEGQSQVFAGTAHWRMATEKT